MPISAQLLQLAIRESQLQLTVRRYLRTVVSVWCSSMLSSHLTYCIHLTSHSTLSLSIQSSITVTSLRNQGPRSLLIFQEYGLWTQEIWTFKYMDVLAVDCGQQSYIAGWRPSKLRVTSLTSIAAKKWEEDNGPREARSVFLSCSFAESVLLPCLLQSPSLSSQITHFLIRLLLVRKGG